MLDHVHLVFLIDKILQHSMEWNVGKEGFSVIIDGVIKEGKSQVLNKAMFLDDVLPVFIFLIKYFNFPHNGM